MKDENGNAAQPEPQNLQAKEESGIIEPDNASAGNMPPEDTFAKTIAKQNETINALLEQVNSLNDQIAHYVRNVGAPIDTSNQSDGFEDYDVTLKDDYVYLKDLGAKIGKREI